MKNNIFILIAILILALSAKLQTGEVHIPDHDLGFLFTKIEYIETLDKLSKKETQFLLGLLQSEYYELKFRSFKLLFLNRNEIDTEIFEPDNDVQNKLLDLIRLPFDVLDLEKVIKDMDLSVTDTLIFYGALDFNTSNSRIWLKNILENKSLSVNHQYVLRVIFSYCGSRLRFTSHAISKKINEEILDFNNKNETYILLLLDLSSYLKTSSNDFFDTIKAILANEQYPEFIRSSAFKSLFFNGNVIILQEVILNSELYFLTKYEVNLLKLSAELKSHIPAIDIHHPPWSPSNEQQKSKHEVFQTENILDAIR